MDILDFIEKISIIVGNSFICAGVIVALRQLKNFIFDNEQRKKQATLEYYQSIREEYVKSYNQIKAKFPNVDVINSCEIDNDKDLSNAIHEYLSYTERFATGINVGVFDIEVFFDMIGVGTIRMYERLKEIILYNRNDNRLSCKDLEKLVPKLILLEKKKYPIRDSDYTKIK